MKKIVIIGGSSGMGLAAAKLAAKNYQVIIASRSSEKLEKAKQEINNDNVSSITVDVRDEDNVKKMFQAIGKIDHLVMPGSEVQFGNIKNSTVETVKNSFDSKFFGPFRMVQAALDYLNPNGSITFFSGASSAKAQKGTEILSAINSAVEGFAKALALSLAPIRVNTISPGMIDTPVYDGMDQAAKNLFKQFTDSLLVKRMGTAEEAAKAVLYLIENDYVTGTVMYVDGGYVIS